MVLQLTRSSVSLQFSGKLLTLCWFALHVLLLLLCLQLRLINKVCLMTWWRLWILAQLSPSGECECSNVSLHVWCTREYWKIDDSLPPSNMYLYSIVYIHGAILYLKYPYGCWSWRPTVKSQPLPSLEYTACTAVKHVNYCGKPFNVAILTWYADTCQLFCHSFWDLV